MSSAGAETRPRRQTCNPNQRSVADLIQVDGSWSRGRRNLGLSLRVNDLAKKLAPVHPGEVLREDFLAPMKLTPYAVARACGVPRTRIERLARAETPVTADTALRLARYFGTTAEFWMG